MTQCSYLCDAYYHLLKVTRSLKSREMMTLRLFAFSWDNLLEPDFQEIKKDIYRMIHTARRRKREERRKKIGLNPKVNLNDASIETPKNSEKTSKFNQDEKLDLEKSSYSNIFCSTLLAIDKNFSASMAAVGEILSVVFHRKNLT